jgi:hypothetical protein
MLPVDATILPSLSDLSNLPTTNLELLKSQLDTYRQQILQIQNSYSLLLKLPGEIRNYIFLLTMQADLSTRPRHPKSCANLFRQPALLSVCRQTHLECASVWNSSVLIWEEYDRSLEQWRVLNREAVLELCMAKSEKGRRKLAVQAAFCGEVKMRQGQEQSGSICERRGLVRSQDGGLCGRWWIW